MAGIVWREDGADRELEVVVGPGSDPSVADLATALGRQHGGLAFDGQGVEPDARIRGTLRAGMVVAPTPSRSDAPAAAHLLVASGPLSGDSLVLPAGTQILGRGRRADLTLACPTISREHVRLDVDPEGHVVATDLRSTNGTRVRGEWLAPDDEPRGASELCLAATDASIRPVRSDGLPLAGSGPTAPLGRTPRPAQFGAAGPLPSREPLPPVPEAPPLSWAAFLAPLVVCGALVWWFGPLVAVFGLLGPVLVLGQWMEGRRRARRAARRREQTAAEQEAARASAIDAASAAERQRRWDASAHVGEAVRRAVVGSCRLWERRPEHPDWMRVTVGVGTSDWTPAGNGDDSPTVPLVDGPIEVTVPAGAAVGLVGDRAATRALARGMLVQLATNHGPADLRVAAVVDPAERAAWCSLGWLPHAAQPLSDVTAEDRAMTVVLLDGAGAVTSAPRWLPAVLDERSAALVVAEHPDRLPAVCRTVIEVTGLTLTVDHLDTGTSLTDVRASTPSLEVLERAARRLARWSDPERAGGRLPERVRLLDLLDMNDPAGPSLARGWGAAEAGELTTPIGVGQDGPFRIDLVGDGPHGLVAGTTGSGKSELLRSVVAGLAATHPPDRCSFVLVDYKGGSAFDRCAELPHVVGVVTDLDHGLAARTLAGLRAELRRRETALRHVGADDLEAHDRAAR